MMFSTRMRRSALAVVTTSLVALPGYAQQPPLDAPGPAPAQPAPETTPAPDAPAAADTPAADTPAAEASAPQVDATAPEAAAETTPPEPPPMTESATEAAPDSALDAEADAMADAEIEAIEQGMAEGTEGSDSTYGGLNLYGFVDFSYMHGLDDSGFTRPSFMVGNFNVYLQSNLAEDWHTLGEIRYTYLPNGNTVFGSERTDTSAADYNDVGRPVRWGGVVLERAWLEYSPDPLFNVRGGRWLTPYGIWNVDHGSPVIIGVRTPYVVGDALFPESQTGLQLHGMYHLEPVKLGYHLTLSNGRGPTDTHLDLDGNKGFGGRLFGSADTAAGTFTLGVSGYQGQYTAAQQVVRPNPDSGDLAFYEEPTVQYDEQAVAADLKWDLEGLAVQSEVIARDQVYGDHRPSAFLVPGLVPDSRSWGWYAQAGYRFDFGGIMPYVGYEYYDAPGVYGETTETWGGLNIRPTPRVVLKGQYTYVTLDTGIGNLHILQFQAAWSF